MSQLPLEGRRVLVTRTRERAAGLVDRLHALGASVEIVPLLTTVPLAAPDEIAAAAAALRGWPGPRWAVFTSATAARLVFGAIHPGDLGGASVAAVGSATAEALRRRGVAVNVVPDRHDAAALAAALLAGDTPASVWLPVAAGADRMLPQRLEDAGADVAVQHVYRSAMPHDAGRRLRAALSGGVDAITLTSGSTARHLAEALAGDPLDGRVAVVCIGGQTAAAAREAGLRVDGVAVDASAEGMAAVLAAHFAAVP